LAKCAIALVGAACAFCAGGDAGFTEEALRKTPQGAHKYDAYEPSERCAMCHKDIAAQFQQSAMARAQALPWDQAEYFKLALPHAGREPKVAPVKAGCINCHAPQAFLAGDIPPAEAGKADPKADGVSCDMCHSIVGFEGDVPANGGFAVSPGKVKHGPRADSKPMLHEARQSDLFKKSELCGVCHNETSPWGAWVKETQREWAQSPYAKAEIYCLSCHMPPAPGKAATGAPERADVAQHIFQGAYSPNMLAGAAQVFIHPLGKEAQAGQRFEIAVTVQNSRAGHRIPTGSAEERQLWLRIEARDAAGKTWHIPASLAPGDSPEKSYSVTTAKPAYFDLGKIMGLDDFKGVSRDALPEGDRLYRKVYLNAEGQETVAQWYTADTDVFDNRLKPLEAVVEKYSWDVPAGLAKGEVEIKAVLSYRRLPQSVADLVEIGEVPVVTVAADQVTVTAK
jgi:hypothetical protein